jgi:hypothetical protein
VTEPTLLNSDERTDVAVLMAVVAFLIDKSDEEEARGLAASSPIDKAWHNGMAVAYRYSARKIQEEALAGRTLE